ncbi:MAG: S8/S53 family peptidase [Bacteroidota bacterium]
MMTSRISTPFFSLIFLVLANLSTASFASTKFKVDLNAPHEQGVVILKVKKQYANQCETTRINSTKIINCLMSIDVVGLSKKFPLNQSPATERDKYGRELIDLSLIYELKVNPSNKLDKVIQLLLATGELDYAEPHYTQQLLYAPNDPSTSLQYYLNKISAYQAWDISQSDTNIVIGVTDTGTDLFHEDLVGNVKYNYLDPIDGIDNDTDGYIDNYYGWDLGENDNSPQCNANFHGLHSTGISSAMVDNNTGIAGVGFKAKYLPIKISDASGTLNTSYEGIVYAVDHGCQIVNCSWGGIGASQFGQDIVNYAAINMNALVIASAGNNGNDVLFYPASYNNVLNVAATDQADHKKLNSTYGITIDVCAPGEDILSTWTNNTYVASGGTSTAAPVVAGAAAIVKSHFPNYSGIQIGEQLRATADNIDTVAFNAPWAGKLGAGRINLFKALTDSNAVSVVLTNSSVTDNNDNAFVVGDTLDIIGEFTNYLAQTNAVSVKASCASAFIQMIDSTITLGNMNTLQTVNNNSSPFKATILSGAPINAPVEFKLKVTDSAGHQFTYYVAIVINVDFINININEVATTVTSKGNIGYNNSSTQGLGFVYNNSNLLYESGLLIGAGPTRVSDRVRGNPGTQDTDFLSVSNVSRIIPGVVSEFDVTGSFNDNGAAANAIPVKVLQNSYAWSTPGNTKYVIFKYKVINTGAVLLDNLFIGVFADWDIMNSNLNKAAFDAPNKMGYCYSTQSNGLYAGIKLLSNTAPVVHYAMDNIGGGGGGIDPTGGINTAEKFTGISTNRTNAGGAGSGNDVTHFVSSGPFVVNPSDTVEVAFAYIAGDSLADLQSSAAAAQVKYDNSLVVVKNNHTQYPAFIVYPNPVKDMLYISPLNTAASNCVVNVLNIEGKIIMQHNIINQQATFGIPMAGIENGIYFAQIISESDVKTVKFIVSR